MFSTSVRMADLGVSTRLITRMPSKGEGGAGTFHRGQRDAFDDQLRDLVALMNYKTMARRLGVGIDQQGMRSIRTREVAFAVVEKQDLDVAAIVGIDHASAHVHVILPRDRRARGCNPEGTVIGIIIGIFPSITTTVPMRP